MREVRVKICGLTRVEDARHAAASGADYLGAILTEGFGRSVAPAFARGFAAAGGPPLVGVLVDAPVSDALLRARAAGAAILQLHGDEAPDVLDGLRQEGLAVWKAIRPRSLEELRRSLDRYAQHADAVLLDGWHAELKGGAGARFDWEMVGRVREELPPELLLVAAGGLTPETVADAVAMLRPDAVDVSSGVEGAPGRKDPGKVEAFIRAARGGPVLKEA
ncbi:MAG: phosphoribosylanthranilate isomerase [Gemmatimonadetes bacterium]|nr:phosphoribosylanthranilate isomerase [Gemmatimonadota bacterium]